MAEPVPRLSCWQALGPGTQALSLAEKGCSLFTLLFPQCQRIQGGRQHESGRRPACQRCLRMPDERGAGGNSHPCSGGVRGIPARAEAKACVTPELPGSIRQPLPLPSEKQHVFCRTKGMGFAFRKA